MPLYPARAPRIVELADRIAADIRRRRLKPGDRYLSAAETASCFKVSAVLANRALQLLSKRKLLVRRQRTGSFIAPAAAHHALGTIRRVHLLVQRDYLRTEGLLADGVVLGIQERLPAAEMQFNFLPAADEAESVERLIAESLRRGETDGFVLVRSSLAVQRLLASSGLPVVVSGSVYPSLPRLCSIDRDNARIGRLLTEHLLSRGRRRIAVLLRQRLQPGDHVMWEAVRSAAAEAGPAIGDLTIRCLPADEEAIAAEVADLLANHASSGIVARNLQIASAAARAAKQRRQVLERDLDIGVCDVFAAGGEPSPFVYTRAVLSAQEQGAMIGELLAAQTGGQRPSGRREVVAVELIVPHNARLRSRRTGRAARSIAPSLSA